MLVDSHCHLDYLERDGDLDEAVQRARDGGIGTMVTICTKVTEFSTVRAIADRYDDVWCTVGIHPHDAANEPAVSTEQLVELAQHPKVIGSAKPASIITMKIRRAKIKSVAFEPISPQRARPVYR